MPEWEAVIEMSGAGETLAAQLIAEIGDINRFDSKKALTGFSGVDSATHQSGTVNHQGEPVTKSGSPHLRRTLFLVMRCLIMTKPDDVFLFFSAGKNLILQLCSPHRYLSTHIFYCTDFLRVFAIIAPPLDGCGKRWLGIEREREGF